MAAAARKIALTDRSLKALRPVPGGARYVVWDATLPGFCVRVSAKGKRSFYGVRGRAGTQKIAWLYLGEYPILSLAEARAKAREAIGALAEGEDPAALAAARRHAKEEDERAAKANAFRAVAERFAEWYRTTPGKGGSMRRTWREVVHVIDRDLTTGSGWAERPVASITERDVTEAIDAIRSSRGSNAARHAFSAARLFFRFAKSRHFITESPCAGIEASDLHGSPESRDRVLTDGEVRVIWGAATQTGYPYGSLLKLLLLTGARLREIAEARWSEIDETAATLTIPTSRTKMKVPQVIALTATALAILADLPRFAAGDYIFSTMAGRRPVSGFSKLRDRFDRTLAKAGHNIEPRWRPHDLRRTCRTALSSLGIVPVVAELVIGHQQTGLAKIYDLHRYEAEKRDALTQWEARLLSIVAPEPQPAGSNIVRLKTASA